MPIRPERSAGRGRRRPGIGALICFRAEETDTPTVVGSRQTVREAYVFLLLFMEIFRYNEMDRLSSFAVGKLVKTVLPQRKQGCSSRLAFVSVPIRPPTRNASFES